jgi:hypothetical protein
VEQFPATELEYWSCYFSIDDNQDKPAVKPESVDVETSKKGFKDQWK